MKYVTPTQIEQIKTQIARQSQSPDRDVLLVRMAVDMGIKPVHLAEMRVHDVLEGHGDVVKHIRQQSVPEDIRSDIARYLRNRFHVDHHSLRSVTLHLFSNREGRGHFTDQSMATHLTFLIKRSGINATATALRNAFIRNCAIKGDVTDLVRLTRVRHPATVVRYLLGEYEPVGGIQI